MPLTRCSWLASPAWEDQGDACLWELVPSYLFIYNSVKLKRNKTFKREMCLFIFPPFPLSKTGFGPDKGWPQLEKEDK